MKQSRRVVNETEVRIQQKEGGKKTCLLINSGKARHNVYYSENILKNSVEKFENVPFYIDGHKYDRNPTEIVGVFKNARWDEQNKGITADLVIFKHKKEYEELIEELNSSGIDIGLSAVLWCNYEITEMWGEQVINVNEITEVESVDFVIHPATLGRFLNSVRNRAIQDTINNFGGNANMDEIKTVPVENGSVDSEKQQGKIENQNTGVVPNTIDLLQNQAFIRSYNRLLIENTLTRYNVDDVVRELVSKEFENSDKLITEEAIENSIQKYNSFYDKVRERQVKDAYPAYVSQDEQDKIINGILAFFEDRPVNGVPPIRSVRKIWQLTTGDYEVTGNLKNCDKRRLSAFIEASNRLPNSTLIANSVSLGDWAIAFGNLMYRQLLREYDGEIELQSWRNIARVVNVNDFRPQVRIRLGGYTNLPIVQEAQNYPNLSSPTEENIQYAVSKRGGTEELTWEAIMNDDVGAVRRIPQKLSFAAARTLFEFVMSFIFDNLTIYDGQPLFSNAHPVPGSGNASNIVTYTAANGVSYKDIIRARVAQRLLPEPNSGKPAGVVPKYVVGSVNFEEFMYFATMNQAVPATRGASSENREPFERGQGGFTTDENVVKTFGLEYIVHPFSTNNTQVFLVADPRRFETIEVGFLGSEQPEMFIQDLPNVGTMFFADKITYKIRHVYGAAVLDFRSFMRIQPA
jgi:hypothetical protein